MRILIDVNVHADVVAWMRSEGHDIDWAAQSSPTAQDVDLLQRAFLEQRVIVTGDLDFGDLIVLQGLPCIGIVLIRIRAESGEELVRIFAKRWNEVSTRITGNLVVFDNHRARVRAINLP